MARVVLLIRSLLLNDKMIKGYDHTQDMQCVGTITMFL